MDLELRDVHLPDPISWWPLAPGYWLLLGIILLVILLTVIFLKERFTPNLRKQAAAELDKIEKSFQESDDATRCLSELSVLLRRAVLSQNHPISVAGLTGPAWLELLDQPLKKPEFSQGIGQILLSGPYQHHVESDEVSRLIQLCRKWVTYL